MRPILIFTIVALYLFKVSPALTMEYNAGCSGNRGRVSLSIYSGNERIYVRYNNALGADDFPFYEGVVTRLTMPFIKIAEEELASLGHEVMVSWPVKNCDFNRKDPLIMTCGGEALFHTPKNTGLTSYTFITSRVTEESLTSKFEMINIRWGMDSQNFHHSLAMPFDPSLCYARIKE